MENGTQSWNPERDSKSAHRPTADGRIGNSNAALRGRDMSAPVEFITLNGTQYKTVYNNQTARIAEDVYEQQYGKDVGYGEILKGIAKGKYSAIMALFYAAIISGGAHLSWEDFDAQFHLDSIEGVREIIARAVQKTLPDVPEQEDAENP